MTEKFTNWRKATASTNQGGSCVEVAMADGLVGVRDSKQNGAGPVLRFSDAVWTAFTTEIRSGARGAGHR